MTPAPTRFLPPTPTYRYVNTGDGWPGLATEGLRVDADGQLTLLPVPGPAVTIADKCASPEPRGPRRRTYRVLGDQVRVVESSSGQTVAEWGPFPAPSRLAFDERWVYLAVDENVLRLDADGVVDTAWTTSLNAWAGPVAVREMVVLTIDAQPLLVVLADAASGSRVLVVQDTGAPDAQRVAAWNELVERRRDAGSGAWTTRVHDDLTGLALDPGRDRLWVVSDDDLLGFDMSGRWVGRAATPVGWRSRTVYAEDTRCGTRLVAVAADGSSLPLEPEVAWTTVGGFVVGPVDPAHSVAVWQELRARFTTPAGCTVRLWTLARTDELVPGVETLPGDAVSTSTLGWAPLPGDPRGALVESDPARRLWIGGLLMGAGEASPAIAQIRVDVATESWLRHLPPIYAEPGPSRDFVDRMLRWLQSSLRDEQELLDRLPARFDPAAADDSHTDRTHTPLDDLADWLGTTLDEEWPESRRRAVVAQAHALHGVRGTAAGLSRLLSLYVDAPVSVIEPPDPTTVWTLDDAGPGEPNALGLTTRLVASAAGGAVVGSTAVPGSSSLTDGTEYGAPVHDAEAHCFCVQAYASDLPDPAAVTSLRRLVDAEKPAHLDYHLCLIGPSARLGFQARVGIDAIVSGPPAELVLDTGATALGTSSALASIPDSPLLEPASRPHAGTAVLGSGLHLT